MTQQQALLEAPAATAATELLKEKKQHRGRALMANAMSRVEQIKYDPKLEQNDSGLEI